MANFLSDIGTFLWGVLSHWQAYMTGGIVMAVLFIYERLWNKTVSTRTVVWGIIAFFIAAFFMAWRDQLNEKRGLQAAVNDLNDNWRN